MEKYIYQNEKQIHYKIEGEGQTLVLLHGYLESLEIWTEHQRVLSDKYQVISIDLPGHGSTANFGKIHPMSFMAEIVHLVLKEENIEKCVMIGHSMGGYTTLAFAAKYAQMLNGFGLFHSQARADDATGRLNRDRTIGIIEDDKGHFINHFIPTLFAPENEEKFASQIQHQIDLANAMPKENVIAAMAGMKERESSLDVLIDSKVPVLFILGKKDARIPLETALAQAALPSNAQILILGNSGHMGWIEEQKKTIAAIDGFMALCAV